MKYFSLFSGIGGFELGIQQAHVAITHRKKNRGSKKNSSQDDEVWSRLESAQGKNATAKVRRLCELSDRGNDQGALDCVGFSEIDKWAIQIYKKHFSEHKNYGDITKINERKLPDFDLLVGGFPCQAFSIAGRRGGFMDTRGTLFFEIARIARFKKPRLLLLENVKGLLSHDNGVTFYTIISTLDELGYDIQWQVLNSKDFGVPQNRERVYIVGHLRGTSRPEVFPIIGNDKISNQKAQSKERSSNIKANQVFIAHNVYGGFGEKKVRRFYRHSPTLRTPKGGGHIPTVVDLKATPNSTRRGQFSKKGFAKTLDHDCNQGIINRAQVRRLTPRECERLQGFPDFWTTWGINEKEKVKISDNQRYKCCGNAVTVNVIQAIMSKLLK